MTENRDNEFDAEVATAYRALAQEQAPPGLDEEILRLARKEVDSESVIRWLTRRLRPVAFVATAVLSLALMFQLSNTPLFEAPADMAPIVDGGGQLQRDPFQDAANRTAEQIRQLETEAGLSMSNDPTTAPAMSATPAEPTLLPAEEQCSASDRADSGSWWLCIRDMELRGLTQAAELELQDLLQAYPQFSAPQ